MGVADCGLSLRRDMPRSRVPACRPRALRGYKILPHHQAGAVRASGWLNSHVLDAWYLAVTHAARLLCISVRVSRPALSHNLHNPLHPLLQ